MAIEQDVIFKASEEGFKEIAQLISNISSNLRELLQTSRGSDGYSFTKSESKRLKQYIKDLQLANKEIKLNQKALAKPVGPDSTFSVSSQETLRGAQLEQFREMHPEIKNVQEAIKTTTTTFGRFGDNIRQVDEKVKFATRDMKHFQMELLSVMFFGMALSNIYKEHTKALEDMYGLTDLNAAAMQLLLLPAFDAFAPIAMDFNEWLINLDDTTKLFLGTAILGANAVGDFLTTLGQFGLGIQGLDTILTKLKAAGHGSVLAGIFETLKNIAKGTWNFAVNFVMGGWNLLKNALLTLGGWVTKAWNVYVNFLADALSLSKLQAQRLAIASAITVGIILVILNWDWIQEQLNSLWTIGEKQNLKTRLLPLILERNELAKTGKNLDEINMRISDAVGLYTRRTLQLQQGATYLDQEYKFLGLNVDALATSGEYLLAFQTSMGEIVELTEEEWLMLKEQIKAKETSNKLNNLIKNDYDEQVDALLQQQGILNENLDTMKDIKQVANSMIGALKGLPAIGNFIPNIPKFAEGGIVTKPTLAMVGERGPEAIVPLDGSGQTPFGGEINVYVNAPINNTQDARSLVDQVVTLLRRELSSGTMI